MRLSREIAATAVLLMAACSIAGAQPASDGTLAQQAAAGQHSAFDVASIHLSAPSRDGHHHIYNDPSVSRFRTVNVSVRDLIQFAYAIPASQIVGGPDWLGSTMFDVDAKSDSAVDSELHAMPSDQARREKQLMVQSLLAERFGLRTHEEIRELPVFALVVANPKTGPKFQPSQINGTTIDVGRTRLHVGGSDDTVSLLARELAQILGRVVLNRTGLASRYDLTLRWTPDDAPTPLLNGAPDPNAPPGLFTAIQEQLGLKLESAKGPVKILVIDHIEHPTEN